jgi:4-amino-4-deoxy-L-arabinose transferase-like glycosyltransferase
LLERPALVLLVLVAFAYGAVATEPIQGRMVFLHPGDDPLTRETQAREIALNGPLMAFGAAPGKGKPYYSQILYPYLLAGLHRLVGEPLAGLYVAQVALLGLLVGLVYLLGKRLFGAPVGALAAALFAGLAWLEYVPVALTLFAEDAYTPLIVGAVLAILGAMARPGPARLLAAGLLLAVAVLVRFTGLLFVPVAAPLAWSALRGQGWARRRAALGVGLLLAPLLLALIMVSARNLAVAGEATFVPASLGNNLVKLHKPTRQVDLRATRSPIYEALDLDPAIRQVIEFARQDLDGYLGTLAPQALYAIGYTALVDPQQPYHAWFLGGFLLYLLAPLLAAPARGRPALLVHGFVLGHWALMAVFFASQYRYRLILPMYPFVYAFAALTLWWVAERALGAARRATGAHPRRSSEEHDAVGRKPVSSPPWGRGLG